MKPLDLDVIESRLTEIEAELSQTDEKLDVGQINALHSELEAIIKLIDDSQRDDGHHEPRQ